MNRALPMSRALPTTRAVPPTDLSVKRTFFPAVEGARAVAALGVLLVHVAFVSGVTPGAGAVGDYTARAEIGVGVFFVISGFLLYRPWARAHLTGQTPPALGRYLVRRLLRIVPLYWAVLATTWLLVPASRPHDVLDAVLLPLFGQVYRGQTVFLGVPQAWSLCVEMAFYLALPLYAALVGRVGRRWGAPQWAEWCGIAVLYACGLGARALLRGDLAGALEGLARVPARLVRPVRARLRARRALGPVGAAARSAAAARSRGSAVLLGGGRARLRRRSPAPSGSAATRCTNAAPGRRWSRSCCGDCSRSPCWYRRWRGRRGRYGPGRWRCSASSATASTSGTSWSCRSCSGTPTGNCSASRSGRSWCPCSSGPCSSRSSATDWSNGRPSRSAIGSPGRVGGTRRRSNAGASSSPASARVRSARAADG